jgi:hypothetical protein
LQAGTPNKINEISNDFNAKIFPNPFSNFIHLESSQNIEEITIVNQVGQIIWEQTLNQKQGTINLDSLEPGLYFLTFKNNLGSVTKRVIKY